MKNNNNTPNTINKVSFVAFVQEEQLLDHKK